MRLVKEAGSEGIFVKTDVANKDDVKMLVEKTVKNYDRLDYAFNNAAIPETTTSLIEQTSNVFDQVMNVNVKDV
jgi:NAD(P)-dependent dehydrogenase (short-subunit alcohol dehydrogenase family)